MAEEVAVANEGRVWWHALPVVHSVCVCVCVSQYVYVLFVLCCLLIVEPQMI